MKPKANITLVFGTKRQSGVILYHGFDQHAAVELFRGRVRVSYDIGNYPVSTMFSYEQVDDGQYHTLELLIIKKNFTMRIDGGMSRTIINEGEKEYMDVTDPLYFGGLPANLQTNVFKKWHVRDGVSFNGELTIPLIYTVECSIFPSVLFLFFFPKTWRENGNKQHRKKQYMSRLNKHGEILVLTY